MEVSGINSIGDDQPLRSASATQNDKLGRADFARAAVSALKRISSTSGFVISIEGPWGSGKTSALAMIEQLLTENRGLAPVIVNFNPWLIGERDSLLRHFLDAIGNSLRLTDHVGNAKKVGKELKNYAKVFDLVKFIPGAEPWATIVKNVIEAAGNSAEGVADQKSRDVEGQKIRLEKELKKLDRSIIVFIDDVDRLFPSEVFEMVRIIKAVGDLPNIGYVVAWDSRYVAKALKSAEVPKSASYLDKIVQIRLPLPAISSQARLALINAALESLNPEALSPLFLNQQERLDTLYHYGLKQILEQPRDITRVFNTISVVEPGLRGEVVFADIVGMVCLMIRAPAVFELLRKDRELFIGSVSTNNLTASEKVELDARRKRLDRAFNKSEFASAVKKMTCHLFPQVAALMGGFAQGSAKDIEGHLGSPGRLNIALQLSVGINDVSLVIANKYVMYSDKRSEISRELKSDAAMEFMEKLGDVAGSLTLQAPVDVNELALAIARLADTSPYPKIAENRHMFSINVESMAMRAISVAVQAIDPSKAGAIAYRISCDQDSLSVAADILLNSFLPDRNSSSIVRCSSPDQVRAAKKFALNVCAAIDAGSFWEVSNPALVLWTLARVAPSMCTQVSKALKKDDSNLDKFALNFSKHSFSSAGGQAYKLPEDPAVAGAFFSIPNLKKHAKTRLKDDSLVYPARAAWQSVVEGKAVYGKDGRVADR